MKKTLKQQNEEMAKYIKQLDGQLNDSIKSDRNGNIISIGFAAIILVLASLSTVQNTTISELERKIEIQKEEIIWRENKIDQLKNEIAMTNWCEELAEESNKNFYVSFGACRLKGNKEIEDAMKHYQLGNKENKK